MEDSERLTLEYILGAAVRFETTARLLLAMPWIADDISDDETNFIIILYIMNQVDGYTALSERLLNMEWIVDGVSYDDRSATLGLLFVSRNGSEDLAFRLMDMPFLQTLEQSDSRALSSLASMASMNALSDILARPHFKDGITDDQTMIVAMLSIVLTYVPHRVDTLLDPSATTVERRMVELPISGEVEFAIVRPYHIRETRQSMDLLENAVREAETLMDAPLPYNIDAVWLLFENATSGAGGNSTAYIVIRPEYDSDDASFAPHLIAHEVAHYYWVDGAFWIGEGMADLMAVVIENKRVGSPVRASNAPCGIKTIMELEAVADKQPHACNYSLGEGLFLDLLQRLGEDAFGDSARKLYAESLLHEVGIEDVRQAFGPDAAGIISRWYGE